MKRKTVKSIPAMALTAVLLLSLTACDGGSGNTPSASTTTPNDGTTTSVTTPTPEAEAQQLALGETAATDIIELTLDRADLTVAVDNVSGDSFFLPKEYSAETDAKNPFVAAKGHTLVAITYTASNLDRSSVEFDGTFNSTFMTIEYKGNTYNADTKYGMAKTNEENWKNYESGNVLLLAGDTQTLRCYVDIPIEADSLDDEFKITFSLPNSKDSIDNFSFVVTEEERLAAKEEEARLAGDEETRLATAKAAALEEIDKSVSTEIRNYLIGVWEFTQSNINYQIEFEDDYCYVTSTVAGYSLKNEGPYSIRKEAIVIEYISENPAYMIYTYENGELAFTNFLGEDEFMDWLNT